MNIPQRLYIYLASVFRTVIPKPGDRIPLTKDTWPHLLSPVLPILFMAYLVRRPNTHLIRILLLPIVLFTSLRAGFCYVWLDPRFNTYNFGAAIFALAAIARALEYTFTVDGIKKEDETVPGRRKVPAIVVDLNSSSSAPETLSSKRPLSGFIPLPLSEAMEVLCAMRGIGFEYGQGVSIPPETRPLEKGPFLRATSRTFFISFLLIDIIEAMLKLTPPLRSPLGGSIFIASLPWPMRHVVSTCLHFATGCAIIAGIEMIYSLLTLFSVAVLSHSPTAWPPVFDNPWRAQSLHEFWASRWHQLLRQTFMVYGGLPGKWLGERTCLGPRIGLLFGMFFASGLYHEFACYAMGRGLDWRVPGFFMLHAFLVLGERIWRRVTGRRIGGWQGSVWVYFSIIVLGQNLIDAWHQRGLGGAMVIPPMLSPTRRILLPVIRFLTERLRT